MGTRGVALYIATVDKSSRNRKNVGKQYISDENVMVLGGEVGSIIEIW
jgi:hypothetical protein